MVIGLVLSFSITLVIRPVVQNFISPIKPPCRDCPIPPVLQSITPHNLGWPYSKDLYPQTHETDYGLAEVLLVNWIFWSGISFIAIKLLNYKK